MEVAARLIGGGAWVVRPRHHAAAGRADDPYFFLEALDDGFAVWDELAAMRVDIGDARIAIRLRFGARANRPAADGAPDKPARTHTTHRPRVLPPAAPL